MATPEHPSRRGVPLSRKLAILTAVTGCLILPASAGAKLLVSTYNEGLEPHAVLQGHTRPIAHPKSLRLEISGAIQSEATGRFTVKCSGSGSAKFSQSYTVSGMTPAERTVPIKPRWDECRVAKADARYTDPFVEGWIQIRAWGTPR
jgi:hypothetical protein